MIMLMTCKFYPSPPSLLATVSPAHIDFVTAVTTIFKSGSPHDAFSSMYSFKLFHWNLPWGMMIQKQKKKLVSGELYSFVCFFSGHTYPSFSSCIYYGRHSSWVLFLFLHLVVLSSGSLCYHNEFFLLPIALYFYSLVPLVIIIYASQLGFTLCLWGDWQWCKNHSPLSSFTSYPSFFEQLFIALS